MSDDHDPVVDQTAAPAVDLDYPYVGPLTFTQKEADRFFGREREARDLLALVARERLVLFYAQSGAGKSSLLNARLIPNLPDQGFDALPVARVSGEIPAEVDPAQVKNIFVFNLILSLNRGLPEEERDTPAELASHTLLRYLAGDEVAARSEAPAENGVAPVPDTMPDLAPTVLMIDQFEEIFTTHVDLWEERRGFFAQLRTTLEWLPNLWVVLTMREDYVPPLEPYAELLPNRLRARFYMQRMEEAAALEAVERPAAKYGRPFDPGVAKTLVDNLRRIRVQYRDEPPLGQYVEPVQLQVVCLELWKKVQNRPLGPITEADLPLDYIDQALTNFYESALANTLADPNVQARGVTEHSLRDWFSHELITETGIRNTIPRNEETQLTGTLPNVAVDILARHFLVRTEPRAGGNWVELVHDRFIGPIQESNQAWRDARLQQDPLLRAADQWDKGGRTKDLLLTGTALQQALAQASSAPQGSLVRSFLEASQEAQRERDLAEAQQREEEARHQATEARRQATRERQQGRRIRVLALFAAAVAVLAFMAAVYGVMGQTSAQHANATAQADALRAQDAEATARAEATRALNAEATARANEGKAKQNEQQAASSARHADAALLTARALSLANQSRSAAGESALLLGQAAMTISPTLESQTALLSALDATYRNDTGHVAPFYPAHTLAVTGTTALQRVAISGDGRILAIGDRAGGLQLWDIPANRPIRQRLPGHAHGAVYGLAFDPTQPRLASASGDRSDPYTPQYDILLWDLKDGRPVSQTLAANTGAVSSLAFSPDGQTLAVSGYDGQLTLWDLNSSPPVSRTIPTDQVGNNGALAFDPAGARLAMAGNGQILIWHDIDTSAPVSQTLPEPNGEVISDVQFSPDGTRLVSASTNGIVLGWDMVGDPFPPETLIQRESSAVSTFAFDSSGQLAVGWEDGSISLLDPAHPEGTPVTLLTPGGAVVDVQFDPTQPNVLVALNNGSSTPLAWDLNQRREFAFAQVLPPEIPVQSNTRAPLSSNVVQLDAAPLTAISPDGLEVAFVYSDSVPYVASIGALPAATPLGGPSAVRYTALAFSPDRHLLALAGCDPTSATAEKPGLDVTQKQAPQPSATPAAGQGACTNATSIVDVWDISGTSPRHDQRLSAGSQALQRLAFHPQEDVLVGGSLNGTILRWDLGSGTAASGPQFEQVPQLVGLAFNHDGTQLAALGRTGVIRVWNWADGKRLASQPGSISGEQYSQLAYVNGDEWLAAVLCSAPGTEKTTCSASELVLWDASSLERLSPRLAAGESAVSDLVFDPGRQTLTALLPDQIMSWNLGRAVWPDLACARAGRNLTYGEWTTAFPDQTEAAYDRNPTCPAYPLDDSFVAAKRAAATDAARDCTDTGRLQGLALLREAVGMHVKTPVAFSPSVEIVRILSEQALDNLRAEPIEFAGQAQACLEQANAQRVADGQQPFDVTQALNAAQHLVLAERGLDLTLSDDTLAAILADLEQASAHQAEWPGDFQTPLAAVYYTLCDRGAVSETCAQFDKLAPVVPYGTTLAGGITSGQTASYYFRGKRGDIVNIFLNADSSGFDPVVRVEGPGDASLENDDSPLGGTLDALIANYILPSDGVYRIVPRAYSGEGRYRLTLQGQKPPVIALGETRSGLSNPGTVWSFQGKGGEIVGLAMDAMGGNLDSYVQLLGPDLQVVGEDEDSGDSTNALLVTRLPVDGTYLVRAGRPGGTGQYALSLVAPKALPLDQPQTATTASTPLWVFDGTQGRWIDLGVDAVGDDADTINLSLLRLGGTVLAQDSDTGPVLNPTIHQAILPAAGQYIVRASSPASTLPYSLTLREVTPQPLATGDVVTGATASQPVWEFAGRTGEVVDLTLVRSGNGYDPALRILQADGTLLASDDDSGGNLNAHLAGVILPADGSYFVQAGPPDNPVPYTLTLTTVTPPVLVAGQTVTSTTAIDPLWSFDGQSGQVVGLNLTSQSGDFSPSLTLVDATGHQLEVDDGGAGMGNARIHAFVLPQTGRYYLQVNPVGRRTAYQLTLRTVEPPSIEPTQPMTSTIAENPVWRLAAEAGQIFNIAMTATVPGFDPFLRVYDTQGMLLAQDNDGGGYPNARLSPFIVSTAGTYLIAPGPGYSTDPYLLLVSEITPTQTIIDSSVTSSTVEQEYWAFDGQAGQVVDISLSDTDNNFDPYVTLFGPDGTPLRTDDDTGGNYNALIKAFVLPQNGRYLVRAGPYLSTVPYTLRVSTTPVEALVPGSSIAPIQDTAFSFMGDAGKVVDLVADDGSSLTLSGPGGTQLATQTAHITTRLAASGTYTLAVDILENSGVHELRLEEPRAEVNTLPADVPTASQLARGAADYWSFDVTDAAGSVITTTTTGFNVDLSLFAPDGARIATGTGQSPLFSNLPVTGTYLLTVRSPELAASGIYTVTRQAVALPAVAQACGMTPTSVNFGNVRLGSKVILGAHRPVHGDRAWSQPMQPYVGRPTSVRELTGVDAQGCPIVRVDLDNGTYAWRVRDLALLP